MSGVPTPRTANYKLFLTIPDHRGWQDEYYENMRILDSGLSSVTAIANFFGVWQNSTAYAIGMRVTDPASSLIYECAVTHTSAAVPTTFAQDRVAHPTYWTSYTFSATFAGVWTPGVQYILGQFVVYGHIYATCLITHVSGPTFDTTKWEELIDAQPSVDACAAQVTLAANQVTLATAQANAAAASAAAAEASAQSVGARLIGTSTTNLNFGVGNKTLTTQTAEGWSPGNYISIARSDAPTVFMGGVVTGYNPGTGVMDVTVDFSTIPSGSFASWNIVLGGRGGGGGGSVVSGVATHANVPASLTSVTLLAANVARQGAAVYNDSAAELLVNLGAPASSSAFTVDMLPGAYYEVPYGYTGSITGIWAAAVGNARVTEFTP